MFEFYRGKRVLVTGGCGFLGGYLCEELVNAGAKVSVIDNFASGTRENLDFLKGSVQIIEGDLRDINVAVRHLAGYEVVFNLAGIAFGVAFSNIHNAEMFYSNTTIQLNVLEACRINRTGRVLMVSSSCVYPDDAPIPTPELPVFTGNPESVNSGYGWAKRVGELAATYYHENYQMDIAICRPFNPYGGRYLWHGMNSHVIPMLVKKVLDGDNPLVVWGSGEQSRNFIHAKDAVRLMMLILENRTDARPVNLGFDNDIKVCDLVKTILEVSGKSPKVVFDTEKPEGRKRKSADATFLQDTVGNYTPEMPLEEGIRDMIQWYDRNKQAGTFAKWA
ncbi:MAG: NAD-dependent epimerase/dehydratase family protein [Victivallaceae bacterium]|nr:NAD-dependent epimerase/dehydratase family protein [Victivallaceae bacterium]